jgi:hypothetical protein
MAELEICSGCGVALPSAGENTHPYLGASPSCWALYSEMLAREYSDPRYMKVHRLTVDAYAAQHPGRPERRTIQSVWLHLAGLYLMLEKGASPEFATRTIASLAKISDTFVWLDPPGRYASNVADAIIAGDAATHERMVRRWAEHVWAGWLDHQARVRALVNGHLSGL